MRRTSLRRSSWPKALRYTLPGLWVGLLLACLSFTPSLLPRPATYQGVITGVDAAIGYALGVTGARVWREFADRPPRRPSSTAWRVLGVVAGVTLALSAVVGHRWQSQVARLVAETPETLWWVLVIPVIAALVFAGLVAAARGVRRVYGWLSRWLSRHMGARAARATGLVLLAAAVVLTVNGVLWTAALNTADRSFAVKDSSTPGTVKQPAESERAGGTGSLVSWDSLGREGRVFAAGGPTAADIADFTGTPAKEPIRAYAGVASAADPQARAELAVRELDRAGGFDRADLLVVTTTGTGWVEPSAAASFEYLANGDSAIVSMQYSHLASWLSFLVDQTKAREAGRDLFNAVYSHWSQLPADRRPRLYAFGESLGSFGAEEAFSGEFDMANRLDGALFAGPPNFNPSYREFVDQRDQGSREVEPVYRDGRVIRFSNRPRLAIPPRGEPWPGARILYLQHPSDPITWWSPRLILHKPDWLSEPRGRDVLPAMRWIPFVTFWQVSADLALGFGSAPGHGHNFTGEHVDGWAAVLRPADWSAAQADRLRAVIRDSRWAE